MALKGPRTGSYTNSVNTKYNFNRLPVADFLTAQTPAGPDEYFKNTTLLLSTSVTNGAQNNTFLDSSNNNFTITRNGNATQGTYSPYSHMGWSNYFDGTGDSLSLSGATATENQNFTIEGWVNFSAVSGSYDMIFGSSIAGSGIYFGLVGGNTFEFQTGVSSSTYARWSFTPTIGIWYHIAVTRSSNSLTLYINGSSIAGGTQTNQSAAITIAYLGVGYSTSYYFKGYISNFRFVTGTAVYTSNFTPSTSPLTAISNTSLLTCQSNRFIDNSTNNFTITRNGDVSIQPFAPFNPTEEYSTTTVGGSGYFDGTGDYIVTPANSVFSLPGDFTLECWIYSVATQAQYAAVLCNINTTDGFYFSFSNSSNNMGFSNYGTYFISSSSRPIVNNVWTHIALTRSGTTLRMFFNGEIVGTGTSAANFGSSVSETTVGFNGVNHFFNGYVSNARIVKGTAVYTGNFTPPAAPILVSGSSTPYTNTSNVNTTFAAANTSLLCNFTNAGIFDASGRNILETVGNAQASQTQTKFGASSMYFDGTGDYLQLPATPNLSFGTGDFTVEFWVRFDSIAADRGFLGSSAGGYDFVWRTSTGLNLGRINTAFDNTFAWSPSINVWYHVAYSRSGTSLKVFVDGAQVGTTATNSNSYDAVTAAIIGGSTTADRLMNGYLDDFRITKGVARYTANFTPPSRTFALR